MHLTHGFDGQKQKQMQVVGGMLVRACVCVYLYAGGGREGLENYMAVLFNLPFLCKPNVTRKTD